MGRNKVEITHGAVGPLPPADQADFDALCERIRIGMMAWWDIGVCLREIRDRRLYRATHKSFEDWSQEGFNHSRNSAGKLIANAAAAISVEQHCNPSGKGGKIYPTIITNEGQAAAIRRVDEPNRKAVIDEARAAGGITAASIKAAAIVVASRNQPDNSPDADGELEADAAAIEPDRVTIVALAAPFAALRVSLDEWTRELRTLSKTDGGRRLRQGDATDSGDIQQIREAIQSLRREIKHATPFAWCPVCEAAGGPKPKCKTCRGAGWVVEGVLM